MNKLSLLIMPMLAIAVSANAAESEAPEGAGSETLGWTAHLKKAAIQISSTEISNAKEYRNSPNSELSGDSETVTKGVLDFSLTQEKSDYKFIEKFDNWFNKVRDKYLSVVDYFVKQPKKTLRTVMSILLFIIIMFKIVPKNSKNITFTPKIPSIKSKT